MFIYKLCFKIWSHCQGFVLTHSNQLGKTKGKQKQTSNIHTTLKYSVYELKHLKTVVVNFILGKKSKQFHYIIVITISQSKWLNPDRNINNKNLSLFIPRSRSVRIHLDLDFQTKLSTVLKVNHLVIVDKYRLVFFMFPTF